MARKQRKPTANDISRMTNIIVNFVSDYREKMISGEVEWTDCITMHKWDLGELYFSMLKTQQVINDVRFKCWNSDEKLIGNIYLKKEVSEVLIDVKLADKNMTRRENWCIVSFMKVVAMCKCLLMKVKQWRY